MIRLSKPTLALVILCLVRPGAVVAQSDTIRAGDDRIDGSTIRAYTSNFRLETADSSGAAAQVGSWTDEVRFVERDGRRVLRREVARFDAGGTRDLWRVHTVDPQTLLPIVTHQSFGADLTSVARFDVDGREVAAFVVQQPDSSALRHTTELTEPAFDLSLYAILLRGFPLRDGVSATFPVFVPGPESSTIVWETMRVTGREEIEVEGGATVPAWVVETTFRPWTVWLTDEAPYIAKVIQRLPGGVEVASVRTGSTVTEER